MLGSRGHEQEGIWDGVESGPWGGEGVLSGIRNVEMGVFGGKGGKWCFFLMVFGKKQST